ncbi:MAG: AAA family ATPase [Deltaproteobacteria bacterium]|nr:AAA family ATPase [Deltaproteobacteria bacterium]
MFTKLSVQNFRAIGERGLDIDLAPVTVFVGENGTGKSSLLQALALTAQSAIEERRYRDLVLGGSKVSFPPAPASDQNEAYRVIVHGKLADRVVSVGFELEPANTDWRAVGFAGSPPPAGLTSSQWPPRRVSYRWRRGGRGGPRKEWAHALSLDSTEILAARQETEESPRGILRVERSLTLAGQDLTAHWHGQPDRVLAPELFVPLSFNFGPAEPEVGLLGVVERTVDLIERCLAEVHYLSAVRGVELMEDQIGPEVRFVGQHGEQTIRLLAGLQAKSRPELFAKLVTWAERFGLAGMVPGWAGEKQLKVKYTDRGTTLELGDAASGSLQGLMLTAQLLAPPGSTILLEEPENDLHPAFEKLLPELFADSVHAGHQVLATTHSEVLVAALGNAVRRGQLLPDQVAVWHLERDGEEVGAERIRVTDRGYLEGWVKSFAKVEQELADEWHDGLPEERQ